MSCLNIYGERYGRLTALYREKVGVQGAKWVFACDCGRTTSARLKDVRYGNTLSCGCLKAPRGMVSTAPRPFCEERPWRLRQAAVRYRRLCARYRIALPGELVGGV